MVAHNDIMSICRILDAVSGNYHDNFCDLDDFLSSKKFPVQYVCTVKKGYLGVKLDLTPKQAEYGYSVTLDTVTETITATWDDNYHVVARPGWDVFEQIDFYYVYFFYAADTAASA